ncbi:MAG: alpha/beta hydrolase-fold protein [Kofleriaceae bacterium]
MWQRLMIPVALAVVVSSCGGDDAAPSTELACGDGVSATLAPGASVAVTGAAARDLAGAAVALPVQATVASLGVTIRCAADIVPPGYLALGPAVSFGPAGVRSDRPFALTLPYKAARLPAAGLRRHVRVVAQRHLGDATPFFAPVAGRAIDDADRFASRITVRAGELVTYQVVAPIDAGATEARPFTFRAIVGISMGGNAAMSIGLRHRDRFDFVGDLGGEPGPSMTYSLGMFNDFMFGGFCTGAQAGQLCPEQQRPAAVEQHELRSDYEHMVYQAGEGVGLTLRRDLYMKAARDLSRALGNPALYNPDPAAHGYAPPGVDGAYLARAAADRCANPLVLAGFYDREFNPDGSHPVITFCDGGDSPALGLGVFDPSLPQDNPAEVLLAVDVDGDGRRGPGEPVITNAAEPFADVGADGVASVDEPGYDPATNPDPAGDDYHALYNPRGTEGDQQRQAGEPFEDVGLDGVAGTCQWSAATPGCYDVGEGDGAWTQSPNVERWMTGDLARNLDALDAAGRRRVGIWMDAGIRDFLNAGVSANAGMGALMGQFGLAGAVYDGFGELAGGPDATYDITQVPWGELPDNVFVRYGDPDASPAAIAQGDGRHVGTAVQVINRVASAFAWLDKRLPEGDRADELSPGEIRMGQTFVPPTTGRDTPYAIFLPPGYNAPANAARRYPVIYFLHGYGQEPDDLVALSAVFENYMVANDLPLEQRFQKFIIVYVDGRCRPNVDGVPVPAGGDGCEGGTFYMDAPAGGLARMETNLLELMDYVDATFRTKPAGTVEVVK